MEQENHPTTAYEIAARFCESFAGNIVISSDAPFDGEKKEDGWHVSQQGLIASVIRWMEKNDYRENLHRVTVVDAVFFVQFLCRKTK